MPVFAPTIRRLPDDPLDAFFQTSQQTQALESLSKSAQQLSRPEVLDLLQQIQQQGSIRSGQLQALRDSFSHLETERQRLLSQVRILTRQLQDRPSSSGQVLLDKMKERVEDVTQRLEKKEERIRQLESQLQQEKQTLGSYQRDLNSLISLLTQQDPAELIQRLKMAKTQLITLMYPYTQDMIESYAQNLEREVSPKQLDEWYLQWNPARTLSRYELVVLKASHDTFEQQYQHIMNNSEIVESDRQKIQYLHDLLRFIEQSYQYVRQMTDVQDKQQKYNSVIHQLNEVIHQLQQENAHLLSEQDPLSHSERVELNELREFNQLLVDELLQKLQPLDQAISQGHDRVGQIKDQLHSALLMHEYLLHHLPENQAYQLVISHKKNAQTMMHLTQSIQKSRSQLSSLVQPLLRELDQTLVHPVLTKLQETNPNANSQDLYSQAIQQVQTDYILQLDQKRRQLPADTQQRIRQLTQQISLQEQHLDDLQQQYITDHVALLSVENQPYVHALKTQYEAEQKVQQLQKQLRDLETNDPASVQAVREVLQQAETEVETARQQVQAVKPKSSLSEEEAERLRSQNRELEQKMASLLIQARPLDSSDERKEEDRQVVSYVSKENEDQIRQLKEQVQQLQQRLNAAPVKQLEDHLRWIVQLESLIRQRDDLKKKLKPQYNNSQALDRIRKQIQEKQEKILQLAQKIKTYYESDISEMGQRVIRLIHQLGLQVEEYRLTQDEIQAVLRDRDQIRSQLEEARVQLQDLRSHFPGQFPERESRLESSVHSLEEEMNNSQQIKQQLQRQLTTLQEEQTNLAEELELYKDIFASYPFIEKEIELRRLTKQLSREYKDVILDQQLSTRLSLTDTSSSSLSPQQESQIEMTVLEDPQTQQINTILSRLMSVQKQFDQASVSDEVKSLRTRIQDLLQSLIDEKKKTLEMTQERRQLIQKERIAREALGQCHLDLEQTKQQLQDLINTNRNTIQTQQGLHQSLSSQRKNLENQLDQLEDQNAENVVRFQEQLQKLQSHLPGLAMSSEEEQSELHQQIRQLEQLYQRDQSRLQRQLVEKQQQIQSVDNELEIVRSKLSTAQSNYRDLKEDYARLVKKIETGDKDILEQLQKSLQAKQSRIEQLQSSEQNLSQLRKQLKQLLGVTDRKDLKDTDLIRQLQELKPTQKEQVISYSRKQTILGPQHDPISNPDQGTSNLRSDPARRDVERSSDKDAYILREIYRIFGESQSAEAIVDTIRHQQEELREEQRQHKLRLQQLADLQAELEIKQKEAQQIAQSSFSKRKATAESSPIGDTVPYLLTVYTRALDIFNDLQILLQLESKPNLPVLSMRKLFDRKINDFSTSLAQMTHPDPIMQDLARDMILSLQSIKEGRSDLPITRPKVTALYEREKTKSTPVRGIQAVEERSDKPMVSKAESIKPSPSVESLKPSPQKLMELPRQSISTDIINKGTSSAENIPSITNEIPSDYPLEQSSLKEENEPVPLSSTHAAERIRMQGTQESEEDELNSISPPSEDIPMNEEPENLFVTTQETQPEALTEQNQPESEITLEENKETSSPLASRFNPQQPPRGPKPPFRGPKPPLPGVPKGGKSNIEAFVEHVKTFRPDVPEESIRRIWGEILNKFSNVKPEDRQSKLYQLPNFRSVVNELLRAQLATKPIEDIVEPKPSMQLTFEQPAPVKENLVPIELPVRSIPSKPLRDSLDIPVNRVTPIILDESKVPTPIVSDKRVQKQVRQIIDEMRTYLLRYIQSTETIFGSSLREWLQYTEKLYQTQGKVQEARLRMSIRFGQLTDQLKTQSEPHIRPILEAMNLFINEGKEEQLSYQAMDVAELNRFLREFNVYIDRELPLLRRDNAEMMLSWFEDRMRALTQAEFQYARQRKTLVKNIKDNNLDLYSGDKEDGFETTLDKPIFFIRKGLVYKLKYFEQLKEKLFDKNSKVKKLDDLLISEQDIVDKMASLLTKKNALLNKAKSQEAGGLVDETSDDTEDEIKVTSFGPIPDIKVYIKQLEQEGQKRSELSLMLPEKEWTEKEKKANKDFIQYKAKVKRIVDVLQAMIRSSESQIRINEQRLEEAKTQFETQTQTVRFELDYITKQVLGYILEPEPKKFKSWIDRIGHMLKGAKQGLENIKSFLNKSEELRTSEEDLKKKIISTTQETHLLQSIQLHQELEDMLQKYKEDKKEGSQKFVEYLLRLSPYPRRFVPRIDRLLQSAFDSLSSTPEKEGYVNYFLGLTRISDQIAFPNAFKSWDISAQSYPIAFYNGSSDELNTLMTSVKQGSDVEPYYINRRHQNYKNWIFMFSEEIDSRYNPFEGQNDKWNTRAPQKGKKKEGRKEGKKDTSFEGEISAAESRSQASYKGKFAISAKLISEKAETYTRIKNEIDTLEKEIDKAEEEKTTTESRDDLPEKEKKEILDSLSSEILTKQTDLETSNQAIDKLKTEIEAEIVKANDYRRQAGFNFQMVVNELVFDKIVDDLRTFKSQTENIDQASSVVSYIADHHVSYHHISPLDNPDQSKEIIQLIQDFVFNPFLRLRKLTPSLLVDFAPHLLTELQSDGKLRTYFHPDPDVLQQIMTIRDVMDKNRFENEFGSLSQFEYKVQLKELGKYIVIDPSGSTLSAGYRFYQITQPIHEILSSHLYQEIDDLDSQIKLKNDRLLALRKSDPTATMSIASLESDLQSLRSLQEQLQQKLKPTARVSQWKDSWLPRLISIQSAPLNGYRGKGVGWVLPTTDHLRGHPKDGSPIGASRSDQGDPVRGDSSILVFTSGYISTNQLSFINSVFSPSEAPVKRGDPFIPYHEGDDFVDIPMEFMTISSKLPKDIPFDRSNYFVYNIQSKDIELNYFRDPKRFQLVAYLPSHLSAPFIYISIPDNKIQDQEATQLERIMKSGENINIPSLLSHRFWVQLPSSIRASNSDLGAPIIAIDRATRRSIVIGSISIEPASTDSLLTVSTLYALPNDPTILKVTDITPLEIKYPAVTTEKPWMAWIQELTPRLTVSGSNTKDVRVAVHITNNRNQRGILLAIHPKENGVFISDNQLQEQYGDRSLQYRIGTRDAQYNLIDIEPQLSFTPSNQSFIGLSGRYFSPLASRLKIRSSSSDLSGRNDLYLYNPVNNTLYEHVSVISKPDAETYVINIPGLTEDLPQGCPVFYTNKNKENQVDSLILIGLLDELDKGTGSAIIRITHLNQLDRIEGLIKNQVDTRASEYEELDEQEDTWTIHTIGKYIQLLSVPLPDPDKELWVELTASPIEDIQIDGVIGHHIGFYYGSKTNLKELSRQNTTSNFIEYEINPGIKYWHSVTFYRPRETKGLLSSLSAKLFKQGENTSIPSPEVRNLQLVDDELSSTLDTQLDDWFRLLYRQGVNPVKRIDDAKELTFGYIVLLTQFEMTLRRIAEQFRALSTLWGTQPLVTQLLVKSKKSAWTPAYLIQNVQQNITQMIRAASDYNLTSRVKSILYSAEAAIKGLSQTQTLTNGDEFKKMQSVIDTSVLQMEQVINDQLLFIKRDVSEKSIKSNTDIERINALRDELPKLCEEVRRQLIKNQTEELKNSIKQIESSVTSLKAYVQGNQIIDMVNKVSIEDAIQTNYNAITKQLSHLGFFSRSYVLDAEFQRTQQLRDELGKLLQAEQQTVDKLTQPSIGTKFRRGLFDLLSNLPKVGTVFNVDESDVIKFSEQTLENKQKILEELRKEVKVKQREKQFVDTFIQKALDKLEDDREKLLQEFSENAKKLAKYTNAEFLRSNDIQHLKELTLEMQRKQDEFTIRKQKLEREIEELNDRIQNQRLIAGDLDQAIQEKQSLEQQMIALRDEIRAQYDKDASKLRFTIDDKVRKLQTDYEKVYKSLKDKSAELDRKKKEIGDNSMKTERLEIENQMLRRQKYDMMRKFGNPQLFQTALFDDFIETEKFLRDKLKKQEDELENTKDTIARMRAAGYQELQLPKSLDEDSKRLSAQIEDLKTQNKNQIQKAAELSRQLTSDKTLLSSMIETLQKAIENLKSTGGALLSTATTEYYLRKQDIDHAFKRFGSKINPSFFIGAMISPTSDPNFHEIQGILDRDPTSKDIRYQEITSETKPLLDTTRNIYPLIILEEPSTSPVSTEPPVELDEEEQQQLNLIITKLKKIPGIRGFIDLSNVLLELKYEPDDVREFVAKLMVNTNFTFPTNQGDLQNQLAPFVEENGPGEEEAKTVSTELPLFTRSDLYKEYELTSELLTPIDDPDPVITGNKILDPTHTPTIISKINDFITKGLVGKWARNNCIPTTTYKSIYVLSDTHADLRKLIQVFVQLELIQLPSDYFDKLFTDPDLLLDPTLITNTITDTLWNQNKKEVLILLNGDIIDPCSSKLKDLRLPQAYEFLLHAFLYNLRLQAMAVGSNILITIGNHDQALMSNSEVICTMGNKDPQKPTYFEIDSSDTADKAPIIKTKQSRRELLLPFYNCSPYYLVRLQKPDSKQDDLLFVHGGLHYIKSGNIVPYDINTFQYKQNNINTNGFDINDPHKYDIKPLFGVKENDDSPIHTKIYTTDDDIARDAIKQIKSDFTDSLVIVGHKPTKAFGHGTFQTGNKCTTKSDCVIYVSEDNKRPYLACVDVALSTISNVSTSNPGNLETLVEQQTRKLEVLELTRDDSSSPSFSTLTGWIVGKDSVEEDPIYPKESSATTVHTKKKDNKKENKKDNKKDKKKRKKPT